MTGRIFRREPWQDEHVHLLEEAGQERNLAGPAAGGEDACLEQIGPFVVNDAGLNQRAPHVQRQHRTEAAGDIRRPRVRQRAIDPGGNLKDAVA